MCKHQQRGRGQELHQGGEPVRAGAGDEAKPVDHFARRAQAGAGADRTSGRRKMEVTAAGKTARAKKRDGSTSRTALRHPILTRCAAGRTIDSF